MHLFLLAALAASPMAPAPIASVTVYSDRARVVRIAAVTLAGAQKIELPLLNGTVDLSSIRVEASGAEVRRVDIAPIQDDAFAPDEARKLLFEIEKLDDDIARVNAELGEQRHQASVLRRLTPTAPPAEPLKPAVKLNPSGWTAAAGFPVEREAKLQARARELEERLRELAIQRSVLSDKARILGGAARRSGHRVTALVSGNGPAKVTLSYLTARARWYPSYDLQLVPETGKVQVSFAGLVSQESGEDWEDAALTLSTAVPATSTVAPKLLSWKIGEKERFIPTPAPLIEPVRPPPAAPPLPKAAREDEVLRKRLLARAAQSPSVSRAPAEEVADYRSGEDERAGELNGDSASASIDFSRDALKGKLNKPGGAQRREPPSPPRRYAPPPPSPQPSAMAETSASEESTLAGEPPSTQMSLAPPPGYRPPSYDPSLPASLSGGYDLAYGSLRAETVRSGKGARRVALFSESWPVSVERKLFPALAKEAFLVAEIKSPSKQVLPGGSANLFVGADPAGSARLGLVSPGEAFTLPLGLDRAIKPVRNVRQVQAEKGLIGKTELTEYVVTTELVNPYTYPIPVRILDQWPVTDDKNVEVVLLKTEPYAIQDKVKGSLEWRLTVPAGAKTVVSFTYSLRRPKGWRMHQQ